MEGQLEPFRAESRSDSPSAPSSRDSDHDARERQGHTENREMKRAHGQRKELHVDPDARSMLRLDHIATLNVVGLGARARREAGHAPL